MSTINNKEYPISTPEVPKQSQMSDTLYVLKQTINDTINNIQELIKNDQQLDSAVQEAFSTLHLQVEQFIKSSSEELTYQVKQLTDKHNSEVSELQNTINTMKTELVQSINEAKTYQ